TIIGATEAQALQRRDELIDMIPWSYSLKRLAGILGVPVASLDLDGPLPDKLALPNGGNGNHTFFQATLSLVRGRTHTVRDV
ncbi:hypothetical protein ABTD49_21080, partial [Acinetobacter baumannii]